ncbi:BgtAc-31490 [Blumeria graminis f. sp. tritici]|uniref:BgtAc-31490 n=2 Tax=Blumeria graminis f. sp. tritici TaxID=62690 RepID=A0A9X9L9Q8_BLUGR|nr:BgtAc-31490 [Blumeria graminis f. sp. tritici]
MVNKTFESLHYNPDQPCASYLKTDKEKTLKYGLAMCEQAAILASEEQLAENARKKRKLQHKVDSDVTMTDSSPSDMAKTIREEVENALEKVLPKNMKQITGTSMIPSRETLLIPNSGQTPRGPQTENSESQETSAEVTKLLDVAHGTSFNPKCFSSYSEAFFTSSDHVKTRFSILTGTTLFVDSLRAQQISVFMVPGVKLPRRFMQMLSLNGNFILHTQMNPKFVENAMTQLYCSIRIRWLFRDKSDNPYYIPKFHVKTPGWEPPRANSRIEKAIDAVKESLRKQTPQLPQSAHLRNPEIKSLWDFLRDESYPVKITIKNLGLAVVTKSWYCNEITTHLSNTNAYQLLVGLVPLHDINMKFKSILRNHVFSTVIRKYLNETTTELPRFHVIPNIHKIPCSSRPII